MNQAHCGQATAARSPALGLRQPFVRYALSLAASLLLVFADLPTGHAQPPALEEEDVSYGDDDVVDPPAEEVADPAGDPTPDPPAPLAVSSAVEGKLTDEDDASLAPPERVAPGIFELDVLSAGALRGWIPQQYPAMDVGTTVYGTWQLDVRANIANRFRIRRAYYESSGFVAPRGQVSGVAEDAADAVSKMAWLVGVLGVPIGKTFEPIVRYEARAFESTAQPRRPVRFVPYDADASVDLDTIPLSRGELRMVSTFETLLVALQWNQGSGGAGVASDDPGGISSAYFGGGYTTFGKPYMIRVGDSYLDEMVFESRFHGGGLASGHRERSRPEASTTTSRCRWEQAMSP